MLTPDFYKMFVLMKKTKDMYELTHLQISLKLRNSRCRLGKLSTSSCKRTIRIWAPTFMSNMKNNQRKMCRPVYIYAKLIWRATKSLIRFRGEEFWLFFISVWFLLSPTADTYSSKQYPTYFPSNCYKIIMDHTLTFLIQQSVACQPKNVPKRSMHV